MKKWLWRPLKAVLLTLAALMILFEEWGYRPLTAWAARLAQWPPFKRLESHIERCGPKTALAFFLVPVLLLFPVKMLALWLIHQGRSVLGLSLIVLAKILGTAIAGRLFTLTEHKLVQLTWFARALSWWRQTRDRVIQAVKKSAAWLAIQHQLTRLHTWFKSHYTPRN